MMRIPQPPANPKKSVSALTKALTRKQPRAAQLLTNKKMGGVIDSTIQPGGLYAGYPGAPIQPLPAPRRRRHR